MCTKKVEEPERLAAAVVAEQLLQARVAKPRESHSSILSAQIYNIHLLRSFLRGSNIHMSSYFVELLAVEELQELELLVVEVTAKEPSEVHSSNYSC